jgi:hypothetical protein
MRRRQILNINRRFDRDGASTSGGIVVGFAGKLGRSQAQQFLRQFLRLNSWSLRNLAQAAGQARAGADEESHDDHGLSGSAASRCCCV